MQKRQEQKNEKIKERKSQYKKKDVPEKKRQEQAITIRKNKKEEALMKKRKLESSKNKNDLFNDISFYDEDTNDIDFELYQKKMKEVKQTVRHIFTRAKNNLLNKQEGEYVKDIVDCRKVMMPQNICNDQVELDSYVSEIIYIFVAEFGDLAQEYVKFITVFQNNPDVIYELVWIFLNVFSANDHSVVNKAFKTLEQVSFTKIILTLLKDYRQDIRVMDNILWCLGNIAGDTTDLRNYLLRNGCLIALANSFEYIVQSRNAPCLENLSWFLQMLTKGEPSIADFTIITEIIKYINLLIRFNDKQFTVVVLNCLQALSNIAIQKTGKKTFDQKYLDCILNAPGLLSYVVFLMNVENQDQNILYQSVILVGCICSGSDEQTQQMLNMDVLKSFTIILKTKSQLSIKIKKQIYWVISNIAAGTPKQIETLITNNELMSLIIHAMRYESFSVKGEATFVICNLCTFDGDQSIRFQLIEKVATSTIVANMMQNLKMKDEEVVIAILEALIEILKFGKFLVQNGKAKNGINPFVMMIEECDGIETLEELQHHELLDIYDLSVVILEDFFNVEEEEDDIAMIQPKITTVDPNYFGGNSNTTTLEIPQFSFNYSQPNNNNNNSSAFKF